MKMIQTYRRNQDGIVMGQRPAEHPATRTLTVVGEVVTLMGWPTPAMRRAASEEGTEHGFYIGTDAGGAILEVQYSPVQGGAGLCVDRFKSEVRS